MQPETVVRTVCFQFAKPLNVDWGTAKSELRSVTNSLALGANFLVTEIVKHEHSLFSAAKVDRKTGFIQAPTNDKNKIKLPPLEVKAKDLYAKLRSVFPHISSRTASYLAQDVMDKYLKQRLDVLIGKQSVVNFRSFPFTTDWCNLRKAKETRDDGTTRDIYIVEFTLLSSDDDTETPRRLEFVLNTRKLKPRFRDVLDNLASKGKLKTVQIFNKKKNNQDNWTIAIPYDRPIVENVSAVDGRCLSVFPPGDGNMLQLRVRMPGEDTDWIDNIQHNFAVRRFNAYQARRREIGSNYRFGVSLSARGHGQKRALKNKEEFAQVYRNSVRTMNQQWAAYVVKKALSWRCSKIEYLCPSSYNETDLKEKYNLLSSHPWYEFKTMLKNKCQEFGIAFEEMEFVSPSAENVLVST